ncbi:MAG: hypothetical protein ACK5WZ_05905 [Pseudobdellovibrionaceae bacterium]
MKNKLFLVMLLGLGHFANASIKCVNEVNEDSDAYIAVTIDQSKSDQIEIRQYASSFVVVQEFINVQNLMDDAGTFIGTKYKAESADISFSEEGNHYNDKISFDLDLNQTNREASFSLSNFDKSENKFVIVLEKVKLTCRTSN